MVSLVGQEDKVLIFSPHPDDDVIGMGGTMQRFSRENVTIAYMTDGSGGFDRSKHPYNPRIHEALMAVSVLGYEKKNICFPYFPFYSDKCKPGFRDFLTVEKLVDKVKPRHIFVCGDNDPNKTHNKCFDLVKSGLMDYKTPEPILIWMYNSVWGDWNGEEDITVAISDEEFRLKVESIKKHESQNPPVVPGEDTRPFHVRIEEKNRNQYGRYEEKFKVVTLYEWYK
jgi:glucosamine-6-phosphate deaminase